MLVRIKISCQFNGSKLTQLKSTRSGPLAQRICTGFLCGLCQETSAWIMKLNLKNINWAGENIYNFSPYNKGVSRAFPSECEGCRQSKLPRALTPDFSIFSAIFSISKVLKKACMVQSPPIGAISTKKGQSGRSVLAEKAVSETEYFHMPVSDSDAYVHAIQVTIMIWLIFGRVPFMGNSSLS